MTTKITKCEFIANYSHGCWIDEHWKGPVLISESSFSQNLESGATIKSERFPTLMDEEITLMRDFDRKGPRPLSNKTNAIVPLGCPAKKKVPYQSILSGMPLGSLHIVDCQFSENKYNGLVLSSVQALVKNSKFMGNLGFAIRIHIEEHKPLLRLLYSKGETDFKQQVQGIIGGPWGSISYKEASKPPNQSERKLGLTCCVPRTPAPSQ